MTKDKKNKRILDKVLMGVVIGGAIGSVVGVTLAPKKGKETRKSIVNFFKGGAKATRYLLGKGFGFLKKKKKIVGKTFQIRIIKHQF